ncbi:MAG: TlpA disulfide reductase family protein, partial [Candidatus Methylomirabilia bacterium]
RLTAQAVKAFLEAFDPLGYALDSLVKSGYILRIYVTAKDSGSGDSITYLIEVDGGPREEPQEWSAGDRTFLQRLRIRVDPVDRRGPGRGKVVFLNFWATWCPPCRVEMASMERLHREFKDRGLAVLAVNFEESPKQVARFMKDFQLSFPTVLDVDATVALRYKVQGLPMTFFIDRNGKMVGSATGARDWASPEAKALIRSLLDARPHSLSSPVFSAGRATKEASLLVRPTYARLCPILTGRQQARALCSCLLNPGSPPVSLRET